MHTDHVKIGNVEKDLDRVYRIFDEFVKKMGFDKRNERRFRLLTEEVLRIAKVIVREATLDTWFEGEGDEAKIFLTVDNRFNVDDREKILSLSSSGKNSAEMGFFDKLLAIFVADDPTDKTWSLQSYREELLEKRKTDAYSQEAWDDLERSVIAGLSENIEVSVYDEVIKLVATYKKKD